MKYDNEINLAIEAVKKSSRLCRSVHKSLITEDTVQKNDRSPVTVADLGAQAIVSMELMRRFPHDPLVGEEDSGTLRENDVMRGKVLTLVNEQIDDVTESRLLESLDHGRHRGGRDRFWTLDPIDGTKGFLRKDQYAIALALIEDGQVVAGVLGCPNFSLNEDGRGAGTLFYAVRGEGTRAVGLDGSGQQQVRVDGLSDPSQARFCESVEAAHADHDEHARISELIGIHQPPYRIDSQCKYAAVAGGKASIYLRLPRTREYREKIWDHAAGVIVVTEAGGRVSDFSGNRLDFTRGRKLEQNVGILATNGTLHDRALSAISQVVEL